MLTQAELDAIVAEIKATADALIALQDFFSILAGMTVRQKRDVQSIHCESIQALFTQAINEPSMLMRLPLILEAKDKLSQGISCASIKETLQASASTLQSQAIAKKAELEVALPPPTTTVAPVTSTPADFTLEPTSATNGETSPGDINPVVSTKKPLKF